MSVRTTLLIRTPVTRGPSKSVQLASASWRKRDNVLRDCRLLARGRTRAHGPTDSGPYLARDPYCPVWSVTPHKCPATLHDVQTVTSLGACYCMTANTPLATMSGKRQTGGMPLLQHNHVSRQPP